MKRIYFNFISAFVLVTTAVFLYGGTVFAAGAGYSDVNGDSLYAGALERLASLNILQGMQDGTFRPNETMTKEQFAVIMVNAAGLKDKAVVSRSTSFFSDIEDGLWSNGYINTAVSAGLIVGNADGTFRPYDKINLAQAATIMVKALGYTDQDVAGVWPSNYIEKARMLELINDMDFIYDSELPRWAVAVMADRLLSSDVKKKTAAEVSKTFAEVSGLGSVKEYIITSTGNMDATLTSYKIRTEQGELTTTGLNLDKYLGHKVKLLFNSDNKVCAVLNSTLQAKGYTVSSVVGNNINYSEGAYEAALTVPDNLAMYYQGAKKTFNDFRNSILQGSVITLSYNETTPDKFEYGVIIDPDMGEPAVVRKNISSSDTMIGSIDISDKSNLVVIKNGEAATLADIMIYDVVYGTKNPYSSRTVLFVYDKKVTGRYDEALPGKASVNKIKIDGKIMEIETLSAAGKLGNNTGAFNIGDRITVLKGKNDKIVDAIAPYSSELYNIAIVLNTSSDISTEEETAGRKIYKAKFLKADGTATELIKVSADITALKGQMVRYEINDGIAEVQPVFGYLPESNGVPGSDDTVILDKNNRKIGKSLVTAGAALFDIINRNAGNNSDAEVIKLTWEDLPSGLIKASKVLFAGTTGPFKDIQMLMFDNLTNMAGQYGILLTESDKNAKSGNYKILIRGNTKTYNSGSNVFFNQIGDVVYIGLKDGMISSMKTLSAGVASNLTEAVDSTRIMVAGEVYDLASDVAVYRMISNTIIYPISINDIALDGSIMIRLYFDKDPEEGGKVRVICVNQY